MPHTHTMEERFDKKFGKLKEGMGFGDDSSEGESAGCDDCFVNQKERQEHKDFLLAELTALKQRQVVAVEGMRSPGIEKVPEVTEKDRLYNLMNENMVIGYNQALSDTIQAIKGIEV